MTIAEKLLKIAQNTEKIYEAGQASGGSGESVEMCTVTIEVDAPIMTDYTVYSSNSNLQVVTTTVGSRGGTFQAAKGTIVMVTPWEGTSREDNQIFGTPFSGGCGVWIITENCTITYTD